MRGLIALCIGLLAAILAVGALLHYDILLRATLSGYPMALFLGFAIGPTELRLGGKWNEAESFWSDLRRDVWYIVGAAVGTLFWPASLSFRLGILATYSLLTGLPEAPPRCECSRYLSRCSCGQYLRCLCRAPTFTLGKSRTH